MDVYIVLYCLFTCTSAPMCQYACVPCLHIVYCMYASECVCVYMFVSVCVCVCVCVCACLYMIWPVGRPAILPAQLEQVRQSRTPSLCFLHRYTTVQVCLSVCNRAKLSKRAVWSRKKQKLLPGQSHAFCRGAHSTYEEFVCPEAISVIFLRNRRVMSDFMCLCKQ